MGTVQPHLLPDMEEESGGRFLPDPLPGDPAQLHVVGLLRHPGRPPTQPPRHHHQRHRPRPRVHLPHHLYLLCHSRRQVEGVQISRRGDDIHGGTGGWCAPGSPHIREEIAHRRRDVHHIWDLYVRSTAGCHEERDQDEERQVHALAAVTRLLPQRRLLDALRAHPVRHLHNDPQRAGDTAGVCAAAALRLLLLVDSQGRGEGRAEGGDPAADDGDGCPRQRQWRRHHHIHSAVVVPVHDARARAADAAGLIAYDNTTPLPRILSFPVAN